jgi:hypothetical protein
MYALELDLLLQRADSSILTRKRIFAPRLPLEIGSETSEHNDTSNGG